MALGDMEVVPTVYSVREHGMVDVPLDDLIVDGELDLDPSVAERGFFTMQMQGRSLRLQARGYIGFIRLNERAAIDVSPRVSIANLTRLLRIGGFAPKVLEDVARGYQHDPTELPHLRDFYAHALLAELRQINAFGRLREYTPRVARTSSPRGRVVMQARETQMSAAGQAAAVRASWFERTADVPANRCLKLAVFLLAKGYARTRNLTSEQRRLARQLNAGYAMFADVSLDARLDFMRDPMVAGTRLVPSTRAHYRAALDVARTVVTNSALALDQPGADVRLPSLVVSLESVFEGYVRELLDSYIDEHAAGFIVEDGNKTGKKLLFDRPPSEYATPDVVVRERAGGRVPLVLDVKYKPAAKPPDRDDLNQVLAYAASYRAPRVVIIQPHARGAARHGLIHLGDIGELAAYQYVIDLSRVDLASEEAEFGRQVTVIVRDAAERFG